MARRNRKIRVNPLRAVSSVFLLASPFLTWITIVSVVIYQQFIVFGTAAQSNLLLIASQESGMSIANDAAGAALASIVLIILGGVLMLKSPKLGLPASLAGLFLYLAFFYQDYGSTTNGLQQTFVSPGVGFIVASAGVFLGLLSPLTKSSQPRQLAHALRTRSGLSAFGVSVACVGLAIDALNHSALGQLSGFIGLNPIEQALHLGLLAGVSVLLGLFLVRGRVETAKYLFIVAAATLALLGIDSAYNISAGSLNEFLGHDITETVLHFAVYYGVALTFIGSVLGRK